MTYFRVLHTLDWTGHWLIEHHLMPGPLRRLHKRVCDAYDHMAFEGWT